MSFDGVEGKKFAPINEIPEFSFSDNDAKEIEKKASIFLKENKFVPVKEKVKLVDVQKTDGECKLIYENEKGIMFAAKSQKDLAEIEKERNKMPGFLGGFFNKGRSAFGEDDDRNFI